MPSLILLENVVGFLKYWNDHDDGDGEGENDEDDKDKAEQKQQKSTTTANEGNTNDNKNDNSNTMGSFQTWRKVLLIRQYQVAHFHLGPTHLGLPNN